MYGSLDLPHHIKAYIDSYSSEYQDLSDEERLLDLGFMLLRGYIIKKTIRDLLKSHPEISEDSNGKWQWTEYQLEKFDWRAIK